ncbi:MAG TPA: hypothetical protein VF862_15260 [Gemmatimonadales bacterium]
MPFNDLRRALVAAGIEPATTRPPGSQGRSDAAATRPARLVQDAEVQWTDVGGAETCPEPLAFLDGVQRHQVVGYAGSSPLVAATVAAAVRERRGRVLATVLEAREQLLLGRPAALAVAPPIDGVRQVELPDHEPEHPIRDLDAAVGAVDDARSALEVATGDGYRRRSDNWVIIDGSLAESALWAADARMLGVSKSHATLPFEGPDLERYLRLPLGHRSSVFQPASRRFAPVYAWGLRLWQWSGRDILFGLVRVEAAPTDETLARVDQYSRWILAERAPVSAPDARWDRLLYGIHSVEEYLRATLGTR